MPFSGTGVFTRLYQWINDEANGIYVDATRTDTDSNDIADGLTNCITRDGQSPALAAIPMGSQKITGLAAGTLPGDATNFLQVFTAPTFTGLTATGAVNLSGATTINMAGIVDIDGATSVTVPTVISTDNSTNAASTAFVVAAGLSGSLPGQVGNSGKFITTDGTTASWQYKSSFTRISVMTASGTWTPPAACVLAKITVVGGGASNPTSAVACAGGSAGGTAIKILAVDPAVTYTVTIGAGGAAVATPATSGNSGGTSSFSGSGITTVSATGAAGAAAGSGGGTPGIGSNGDINIRGGCTDTNTGNSTGLGGASFLSGEAANATAGNPYGGGAGGSYGIVVGWAGASGVIIIEY